MGNPNGAFYFIKSILFEVFITLCIKQKLFLLFFYHGDYVIVIIRGRSAEQLPSITYRIIINKLEFVTS